MGLVLQPLKIAPSLLAADFARLAEEVQAVEAAGADWLHLDVMDGHFVPNLTIGPSVVASIRQVTQLPLDVHLMIDDPAAYVEPFVRAGANHITFHIEAPGVAAPDRLSAVIREIRQRGATVGISLKPATPVERLEPVLPSVDLVLVMTVEPGFGGQRFMADMLPKISWLRERFSGDIEVDGGLDGQTALPCIEAGASVIVAGTSIFRAPDYAVAIARLKTGHDPNVWPATGDAY